MDHCRTTQVFRRQKALPYLLAALLAVFPGWFPAAGSEPAQDTVTLRDRDSASPGKPDATHKIIITGYVFDENREPLYGAYVVEEGNSDRVAFVDKDGFYSLETVQRQGLRLVYSFLGAQAQTIEVGNRTKIDVTLRTSDVQMDQVVVTGYGNVLQEAYTGSAYILGEKDLENRLSSSFEGMLSGLVPGLVTAGSGQPGDAVELRMRGFGSMSSDNQPLYVIDGVIFDQDNTSGHSGAVSNPMATINPYDIANITFLKDAASASLYGSRGANGVIVITTKQGVASDRIRYSFSAQGGVSTVFSQAMPDLVNAQQYKELWTQGQFHRLVQQQGGNFKENLDALYANKLGFELNGRNYYQWYTVAKQDFNNYYAVPRPDGSHTYYDYWGADADKLPDTDWNDAITRVAGFQQYDFSLSGGSSNLKYYMSLGYLDQQGIIINSRLQRYSARLNMSSDDRKKRINWGVTANIGRTEQSGPVTTGVNYNQPHYAALLLPSVVPAYLEDGSYNLRFPNNLLNGNHNPIASAQENIRNRSQFNLFTAAWARVNIAPWLDFRSDVSQYYITGRRVDYFAGDFGSGYAVNGEMTDYDSKRIKISNKNMLNFNHTINNRHRFSATAGLELVDFRQEWNSVSVVNFMSDEKPSLSNGTEVSGWSGSGYDYSQVSIVTRADYSYRYRYFIGGSWRQDHSSRFSPRHRAGNFWSVSAAYRITNENWEWLKPVREIFNNIKFKGSYGYNGTLPSSYYSWRTLFSGASKYNGESALAQSYRATYDLSWEKNRTWNAGVDLSIFKDRIRMTLEYYQRKSSDLLQNVPVTKVSGYNTILMNTSAGILNRGWELDLNARIVNGLFRWDTRFNLASLKSAYYGLKQDIIGTHIMRNGESVASWYMYKYAGIDPNTGGVVYYGTDANGNDILSDSENPSYRRILGKGIPSVTGGMTNLFSWRGWELSVLFTYGWGHKVFDSRAAARTAMDGVSMDYNIDVRQLDSWTPDNIYAANRIRINGQTSAGTSSRYLYKGDYFKLKNARLNYTFPASTFRKIGLSGVTIYAQADNLWVWTELKGYDPALQIDGNINIARYPSASTYTLGVNLNF